MQRVRLWLGFLTVERRSINGRPCDLQVLPQQEVRHLQDFAEIIETVLFVVGGKGFGGVDGGDINVQQIAKRIAKLRTIQPP